MAESQLPGAENFLIFLRAQCGGRELRIVGPTALGATTKLWRIFDGDRPLGEYKTIAPQPGETESAKEYLGIVPGYRKDTICLHYDNHTYRSPAPAMREPNSETYESPERVETAWQRQDPYTSIVFP